MTGPTLRHHRPGDAEDQRIRRSWLFFSGTFVLLGVLAALRLSTDHVAPLDWLLVALIVVVGFAAIRHRIAVQGLEAGRRAEAESFARILQGLSRSISPDAIMEAIIEEIGTGTGADHIVVVRRRPDARVLEATLVNARTGGPHSKTLFPISDLENPPTAREGWRRAPVAVPVGAPLRAWVGVPIEREATLSASRGGSAVRTRVPRGERSSDRAPGGGAPLRARARTRPTDASGLVADRIADRARSIYGLRNTLVAPLTTETGIVGAIVVSRRTAEPWPASAQRMLIGASEEASAALARAYSHREAEARASTDALTGLPNRRYFDEFCALLARRRRAEDAVGILMVDIDHFKLLNDAHGHAVGDEVLRAVARAIGSAVREDDVPARFGGEEFAVLLRNPTLAISVEVGERVREAVRALDLARFEVDAVSVSVGVAVAATHDEPITDVIAHADRALYEAKRAGRDRVVAAERSPAPAGPEPQGPESRGPGSHGAGSRGAGSRGPASRGAGSRGPTADAWGRPASARSEFA